MANDVYNTVQISPYLIELFNNFIIYQIIVFSLK